MSCNPVDRKSKVIESSLCHYLEKENYRDTVLEIIYLGGDTDTGTAIVGLAGLYYGDNTIFRD
ncbi:ADP-ribosylglycohydrolase family protein [Sphingobacterium sp.]|uniref:ADP-ribosylglycohydrolase family protein n=1 Tax=Sphingobacterium sp. TaxID=341027 RepID=UPI002FDCCC9C